MNRPIELWFFDWLGRHKSLNRSAGWKVFEAEGDDVYGFWAEELARLAVTEAEADAASRAMAREPSRYPEAHLDRLRGLVRDARDELARVAARAERESLAERHDREAAELVAARAAWGELAEVERFRRIRSVLDRYPGLAGARRLVERFALDEWRGIALPDPATFASPPRAEPPAPRLPTPPPTRPVLDPELERELIAQAAAKRRADLDRLRATQPPRSAAPAPPTNVAI